MNLPDRNPFETPRPRGVRWLQGELRVIVAAQCFGTAATRLQHHQPDACCELLGKLREIPADQLGNLANFLAFALIVGGVLTLLRPSTIVLLPIIAYQSILGLAPALEGETTLALLSPAIQITRSVVPLALMLVDFWPPQIKPSLVLCLAATGLLRLATAISFLAQGLVCLDQCQRGGDLVELFQQAAKHGFHQEIGRDAAQRCVGILGAIDFALATALMAGRNKAALVAAILFASLNIFSHTFSEGAPGAGLSLSRISEMGAPLAILLFQVTTVREQKPVYLAERRVDSPHPAG